MANANSYLGNGITFPLKRAGSDFENTSGPQLVFSSIPFVLLTLADGGNIQGDIPWDTGFGSQLIRMKFSSLEGLALRAFVEHWVVEALYLNEPRILVRDLLVEKKEREIQITITVSTISEDVDGNDVRSFVERDVNVNLPF